MKRYLVGDKIKLVKFTDQYITNKYLNWLNDYEINRYLNTGRFPVSKQDMVVPSGDKNLMFAMVSNISIDSAGKLWQDTDYINYIGTCSIHDIDWINRRGEIGYMLGDKYYWGAGITTEVVSLLVDYGFNRLNLNKITAGVVESNLGSIRVLEKNGFRQFSTLEQEYFLDGKYMNTLRFHNFQSWHK